MDDLNLAPQRLTSHRVKRSLPGSYPLRAHEEGHPMAADAMTKDQAWRYWHISLATLDRWIDKGLISVVKLERCVLIRKAALEEVERQHESRRPGPDAEATEGAR